MTAAGFRAKTPGMRWRLWKLPRELTDALWRALFAVRDTSTPPPRVRLVLPERDPERAAEPSPPEPSPPAQADALPALLALLQGHAGYRTAEELAAEARARGGLTLRARDVRELLSAHGGRHVQVRLREEAGSRIAEFKARPTA